jgi:hypothetical protein
MFFQVGCATKYILPGNRFMTPESQGGAFNSQIEIQQAKANKLSADLSNSSVKNGVDYEDLTRLGVLLSTSLLDQIDVFWSHVGGGNSLLGVKYQFLGASRTGNGTGQKMAISAAFGSNEHETEDETPEVKFKLGGKEFQILYGYRFDEMFLVYSNFSYATYTFESSINSTALSGLKPEYESTLKSLLTGVEFSLLPFSAKVEAGYQLITTTDTKNYSHFLFGYSLGYSF